MLKMMIEGEISRPSYDANKVIALREQYNLTQEALCVLMGVSLSTVQHWEEGDEAISVPASLSLNALDKLGIDFFRLMNQTAFGFDLNERNTPHQENLTESMDYSSIYNLKTRRERKLCPERFDREKVSELRTRLGITRQELADLMGVSKSAIDKWESGIVEPRGPALTVLQLLWMKGSNFFNLISEN